MTLVRDGVVIMQADGKEYPTQFAPDKFIGQNVKDAAKAAFGEGAPIAIKNFFDTVSDGKARSFVVNINGSPRIGRVEKHFDGDICCRLYPLNKTSEGRKR